MPDGPFQVEKHRVQELYRHTRNAALGGLIVTLSLGIAKLLGGWFGHSLALLSDAVHSLGDALSSAAVLGALWWAEQPADREHPYGHTRIESITASYAALVLMLSGLWVGWEAITTWDVPPVQPQWYTLAIAVASIFLNEGIYRYSSKVARRTGSKAVEAAAWDQRLDVFSSMVVLLSLALLIWGGPGWHHVDHLAALGVAAIILWAGGSLFWGSLHDLMDRQAGTEMLADIRRLASAVPGVRGVEKLHARKSGLEYLVDIHVEVDPEISVYEGHKICHDVKDRLMTEIVAIKDVLVHIEPSPSSGRDGVPGMSPQE